MEVSRRTCLSGLGALAAASFVSLPELAASEKPSGLRTVRYCLNTSTIRGQNLPLEQEVDMIAAAGYNGIEPWIREIETYQQSGKSLKDLKHRIADQGLHVESAIGFARWIVDDDKERAEGLDQMKREMDLVAALGGTHIAAPPVGMHGQDASKVDLFAAAERYAQLLEIGRNQGVIPQVEIWGPSKNLSRLGEAIFVAVESGDADACLLPDVYHIYRGGSEFEGLGLLTGQAIHCFHFNDYPTHAERTQLNDGDRVYPGEGIAPWGMLIGILERIGFNGAISLELFNKSYWNEDPGKVLAVGLQSMKNVIEKYRTGGQVAQEPDLQQRLIDADSRS